MGSNRRWKFHIRRASITAAAIVALALVGPIGSQAQAAPIGFVRGQVVSKATGAPIGWATISLPDFGVTATSARDGSFAFSEPLPTADPYRRIGAVVTAPGYGRWILDRAPLWANDTLILHAELTAKPFTHTVLTPQERTAKPSAPTSPSGHTSTCTGWAYQLVPPSKIWVWRDETQVTEQYDFLFYVQHVLPDEWISSWDADALGAGAIAAKTYAAYRTMAGHAYSGGDDCADVIDTTADQVFDPTWSTGNTDQAVNATFGSVLYRDGGLFLSQYWSGAKDDPCAVVTGQYAGRMSQWGTQTCALAGKQWPGIVTTFYTDTTWNYKKNFLLNPGAESPAMGAWHRKFGSYVRTKGGAHQGNWWIEVTNTSSDRSATLREDRPFDGTASTPYHTSVAVKCPKTNKRSCSVTIKVIAIPDSGPQVTLSTTVTEKNDGVWRVYTFDPDGPGVAHSTVRLSIVSKQTFGVDDAYLNAPYGGP